MNARVLLLLSALAFAPWPGLAAIDPGYRLAAAEGVGRSETYRQARRALEEERWSDAVDLFGRAVAEGGSEAAAALYWQAYAQNRAGRSVEALESARRLEAEYPDSSWVDDARALELEIRPPDEREVRRILRSADRVREETRAETRVRSHGGLDEQGLDEETELQLYALNSLMNADPERAVPVLEEFLDGDHPIELKERALFVLANGGGREGRRVLRGVAAGERGPELQMKAIHFLGVSGASGEELLALYGETVDRDVKSAVLQAMMVGGDREELGRIVESETDRELKGHAIRMLAVSGGGDRIRALYGRESDPEMRERMLESTVVSGDAGLLEEALGKATDPDEQETIVGLLGVTGRKSSGVLLDFYRSDPERRVKEKILGALMVAGDAESLVEIVRSETDRELKREALQRLSMVDSDEAERFFAEILER